MSEGDQRPSWAGLLVHAAIAAVGAYRLYAGGDTTLAGSVLSWGLLVFGGGMLVLGLISRLTPSTDTLAGDMADLDRKMWSGLHERRTVDEHTIREYGLDLGYYDRVTADLSAAGFRRLADYVDVTGQRAMPSARAVLRSFLSQDGTVMVGVYHLRFTGWMRLLQWVGLLPRRVKSVDMETELSDGTFVATSNAALSGTFTTYPGVFTHYLSPGSAPTEVSVAHAAHVARILSERPEAHALTMSGFGDLCASQDRMQLLKNAFRNSSRFSKVAEMERVAGRPLGDEERDLAERAERLRQRPPTE